MSSVFKGKGGAIICSEFSNGTFALIAKQVNQSVSHWQTAVGGPIKFFRATTGRATLPDIEVILRAFLTSKHVGDLQFQAAIHLQEVLWGISGPRVLIPCPQLLHLRLQQKAMGQKTETRMRNATLLLSGKWQH